MTTTPKKAAYRLFIDIIEKYKEAAYVHAAETSKTQTTLDRKSKEIVAEGDAYIAKAKELLSMLTNKP